MNWEGYIHEPRSRIGRALMWTFVALMWGAFLAGAVMYFAGVV